MKEDKGSYGIESTEDFFDWRILEVTRHKPGVVKVRMQRVRRAKLEQAIVFSQDKYLARFQLPGNLGVPSTRTSGVLRGAPRAAAKKAVAPARKTARGIRKGGVK